MNHVTEPESVADHSMRTAYLALILCPPEVDRAKAVQMALIHDLAESCVGDITPLDGVSLEQKHSRENAAWVHICKSLGNDEMHKLWREMEQGATAEAQFVMQLDKLEMLIQAEEYEKLQPGLDLGRFFQAVGGFPKYDDFFTFDTVREVYEAIKTRRAAAGKA
jgi:putative hydrolase of HD superfamily